MQRDGIQKSKKYQGTWEGKERMDWSFTVNSVPHREARTEVKVK